jgi:hypothetical protein
VTRRVAAVLVPAVRAGFPSDALRLAMVEDCYETVAALELVEPALAVVADDPVRAQVEAIAWPGTAVHVLDAAPAPVAALLDILAAGGADEATVVTGDAPDLPGLLLGKLHRALGTSAAAVLPADGGGLVALAARCPLPPWLRSSASLDAPDALARLHRSSPRRTSVAVAPGWHRVRRAGDIAALDPGLEGWELTRAVTRA